MKQVVAVLLALFVSSQSIAQSNAMDVRFEREQKMIGYGLGPGHKITLTEKCEILIFDEASKLYRLPAASIDVDKVYYPREGEPASALFHAKSGENFEVFNSTDGTAKGTPRSTDKIELFVGVGRAMLGAFGNDVEENYHIAFVETISNWVSSCTATSKGKLQYWFNFSTNSNRLCTYSYKDWKSVLEEAAEECGYEVEDISRVRNGGSSSAVDEALDFETAIQEGNIGINVLVFSLRLDSLATCSNVTQLEGYYFDEDNRFVSTRGLTDHRAFTGHYTNEILEETTITIKKYVKDICELAKR